MALLLIHNDHNECLWPRSLADPRRLRLILYRSTSLKLWTHFQRRVGPFQAIGGIRTRAIENRGNQRLYHPLITAVGLIRLFLQQRN